MLLALDDAGLNSSNSPRRSFGLILTADNAEWELSIHRNVQINIVLTGRRDISAPLGKRLFGFHELN